MALLIGTQIDTQHIPIKSLVPEQGGSAPGSPVEGQMWTDTTNHLTKIWLAGAWMTLGAAGQSGPPSGTAGGALTGTYPNPSLAAGSVGSAQITDGSIALADLAFTPLQSGATAGGDLTGTYPNPTVAASKITLAKIDATTVRLDTVAQPTGSINLNGQKLVNTTAAVSGFVATDVVNRAYVDAVAQGLTVKPSVRAATTINITLANAQTVDGIALIDGDVCLVKNQTTASQNGIYFVVGSGSWTRHPSMDAAGEFSGAMTYVENGTAQIGTQWVCTTPDPIVVGTTNITWSQFSGAAQITAGTGITKAGNTLSFDQTYGDGRYVNVSGGDSVTGVYVNTAGAGNCWKTMDSVQNLETRMLGTEYGFYQSGGTRYGGLAEDPANTRMTLSRASGTIALSAPVITVSQNPASSTEVANKAYVDAQVATAGQVKKYAALIGGSGLPAGVEQTITHNLGTQDVIASFRVVSNQQEVLLTWRAATTNTIAVTADGAGYSANAVTCVVIG